MSVSKKVLVLGDNDLASLSTVRSLGRAGLEVHLVAWYEYAITRASRYVTAVHNCGHPEREPHQFAAKVVHLIETTSFDLVIPILDAALIPLLDSADTIRQHCAFAAPNRQQFEMAYNKGETIRLAQQLGIDIPATAVVSQPAQLHALSWPEHFPIILKPALGGRVRKVSNYAEAEQKLEQMMRHGPVLVQEFCPGHGVGVDILSNRGTIHAAFQHERVHEPPEGGVSSYRKSVPLSDNLLAIARRLCETLQWTGPAMFEFKADPATGRTVLMEINGRLWGSLALSIAAGVDFPILIYDMFVKNKNCNVFSYRIPCFTRNTLRDVFWFFDNLKVPKDHPQLLKVSWPTLTRELGNVLLGRERWDVEQFSDPIPALLSWAEVGREATKRLNNKFCRVRCHTLAKRLAAQVHTHNPQVLRLLCDAQSVLFLCQGNIHRSAFAAQRTKNALHWQDKLQITSAGFVPENRRPTSQVSLRAAKTLNVDLSRHQSQTVTTAMLAQADLIFIMDQEQLLQVRNLDASLIKKVVLLGALDPLTPDWEIGDPDGKSQEVYQRTYAKISRCIEAWLQHRSEVASRKLQDTDYSSLPLFSTAK